MTISSFDHYTPLSSDPKLSRNWASKEDVEVLKKEIVDLKEGIKRNFIRIDKLEKETEIRIIELEKEVERQQQKTITALKRIVEYVDELKNDG